ncbi:MAG: hypothetical protein PHX34_02075 [Candidatus Shapirobacteria bacterium]|nr:hypothetical protein [Candidatus Shapirobacteria bacterium]
MGKIIKILDSQNISIKTVFSKRISIEKAETFHLHYRNIRFEFNEKNFKNFALAIKRAYSNYISNKGIKYPGQVFLEYNSGIKEKEIISPDKLQIELCENLYPKNRNSLFGKNAEFYNENLYIHFHYRNIRLELPISEFEILSKSFIFSYLNYNQTLPSNTFNSFNHLFKTLSDNKIDYLVIRNWDEIIKNSIDKEHPDVDILINPKDIPIFNHLTNASSTNLETYRVQRKILIKIHNEIRPIFFDVRTTTDNYFPKKLSEMILKSKQKYKYIFIPNKKYYFLSLLYHAHFHKPELNINYINILKKLYQKSWFQFNIKQIKDINYVTKFFLLQNINIVEPFDKSVYYNTTKKIII